jgi:hypothetical protein
LPAAPSRWRPAAARRAIVRYIEAAVGGLLVGCPYLPNGNPASGPKFDYKLRLFERLTGYSQSLLDSGAPAPISRGTGSSNLSPSSVESSAILIPRELADQSRLARRRPSGSGTYLRRLARQLGVSQPGGHHGCLRDGLEPVRHQVVCRNRLGDQMLVANHRSGQLRARTRLRSE